LREPLPRVAAALAVAHGAALARVASAAQGCLGAEPTEPREHRGQPIEVHEDRIGLGFADEPEGASGLDGGCGLVAFGAGAAEPLAPIVTIARRRFGEL
jgi:hypothetical protein